MRATLASTAVSGLVLLAASPASAAGGTPTTPTDLFNGYTFCSTDVNSPTYLRGTWGVEIMGVPHSTDAAAYSTLTEQFQVWPVADPSQVTTLANTSVYANFEGSVTVPADVLAEGRTYAWHARTVDGAAASDWSAPCYIAIDNTLPSGAPIVSSPNYLQNQWNEGGEPARFTLETNGVDDVAGFVYSWRDTLPVLGTKIGPYGIPKPTDPYANGDSFIRATTLGGTTTVSLQFPAGLSHKTLTIASLDRAFNRSSTVRYDFFVKSTEPTVEPVTSSAEFDRTTPFRFTPNAHLQSISPVLGYSVRISSGEDTRTVEVPAEADGTAVLPLRLNGIYGTSVHATSRSANGWISDEAGWGSSYNTAPTVTSNVYAESQWAGGVGTPGTFTFLPNVDGIVSYTYSFDWGPGTTVMADNKGQATVDWTPDQSGYHYLEVHATTRDGVRLASYEYGVLVN